MAKPYERPDKQKKNKKGPTKGSGGQRRRGLRGKGATPKAEDRVYHAAHKRKLERKRRDQGRHERELPDMVVGRNPVVECLHAKVPAEALFVARGTGHDDRLSEANTRAYPGAVRRMTKLRAAARAAGRPEIADDYLADVRRRNARRPSLIKRMDAAGL